MTRSIGAIGAIAGRARMVFATVMVCGLVASAGARTNDAGSSGGLLLRLGSGARGPAMGDALTASATGYSALHYNPAGLGFTDRAEVGAMYQNLVLDVSQGEIGFEHPLNSISAWGLNASYLDYGRTQRVLLSDVINNNNSSTSFGGQDFVVSGSYGRQFNEWWSAGITAKVINEQIDNTSATAVAADIGVLFKPTSYPVRFAVTGQNLGSSLQFNNVSEDLPALVRGGVAVDFFNNHLTISGEAEYVRNQSVTAQVGGEVRLFEMLALRVGYDGRVRDLDGITAGAGLTIDDLAIDYAYVPYGDLGNNHRVSLIYKFGAK